MAGCPAPPSSPVGGREGWVREQFASTVPMSTYLVALAITVRPPRLEVTDVLRNEVFQFPL